LVITEKHLRGGYERGPTHTQIRRLHKLGVSLYVTVPMTTKDRSERTPKLLRKLK